MKKGVPFPYRSQDGLREGEENRSAKLECTGLCKLTDKGQNMGKTIGIIVGSLRKDSFNRAVARHVASLAPEEIDTRFIDISALPFYNQDLEETPPPAWLKLREEVRSADALLFFTPEYNRSIPAVLKNALDVGSRPYGQNSWSGKPGGIVSVSPGAIGAFGSNHHLRQTLTCLNVYTLQQPEAYLGHIDSSVDEQGQVVSENTRKFLQAYMDAFVAWMGRF